MSIFKSKKFDVTEIIKKLIMALVEAGVDLSLILATLGIKSLDEVGKISLKGFRGVVKKLTDLAVQSGDKALDSLSKVKKDNDIDEG